WRPGLEVIRLGLAKSHVAGAEQDHAVRNLEALEHIFGILHQQLELITRSLRFHELDELDLVELMQSDIAAGVLPGGPSLAPKIRRPGHVLDRERGSGEDFFAVHVRHRDLGGRDQEEILLLDPERIVLELGELTGSGHRRAVQEERWKDLDVVVLAKVQINHEIQQGALEPGASTLQEIETRCGNLDAALEIEEAEPLTQFVM